MKNLIFSFLLFSHLITQGQGDNKDIHIDVAIEKSVFLIFTADVRKYTWSDKDSVNVVKDENKIIINSRADEVADCNMLVETVDGYYYSFLISVKSDLKQVRHIIKPEMSFFKMEKSTYPLAETSEGQKPVKTDELKNVDYKRTCMLIDGMDAENNGIARINKKMTFLLAGIYIKDGVLFFKLLVKNDSNLPFEVDVVNFILEQKTAKVKRTAVQAPMPTDILYQYNGDVGTINKGGIYTFIYVLKTFTIEKEKQLFLEFYEKSRARSIRMEIPYKALLKAKQL
jgi:hypothetical protein